ncbi:glycosyltransferase [Patescibacteria group bacterium]|nr:glycosyltransferase [Patescibacteria group bacterium]
MIKFSIIIPCRSITDFLKESIPYLKKLNYKQYEILIVLDNDDAYDFRDNRFKVLVSGPVGPAEKRNLAVSKATGDILAFLDDDAFPTENWLDKAAEYFNDPSVYALGGPAMTPGNAGFLELVSGLILESCISSGNTVYRHLPKKARKISDYPTVNLFVRRKIFIDVKGFNTDFWPGEDTKLCLDLVKKMGGPFVYAPNVLVYHHRRDVFIPHLKQVSRYGKHRGQFAKIYPETSRLPFYFVPSMFVVFLVLGGILSVLFKQYFWGYLGVISLYVCITLLESIKAYTKSKKILVVPYFVLGVFLTHLVYGINFIIGYLVRPELKLKRYNEKTGNYMEG